MPTLEEMLQSGELHGSLIASPYLSYEAGENITIEGSVISAKDTVYTAGENIDISDQQVISAVDTQYQAGQAITITGTTINSTPEIATNLDINQLFI